MVFIGRLGESLISMNHKSVPSNNSCFISSWICQSQSAQRKFDKYQGIIPSPSASYGVATRIRKMFEGLEDSEDVAFDVV